MKKVFCILLCGVLLGAFVLPVLATSVSEYRETLADGSYIVTVTDDDGPRHSDVFEEDGFFAIVSRIVRFLRELIQRLTGTGTVTKTKYVNYYDADDTLLWTVWLTATFTCNRQQVTCVSASARSVVYDGDWSVAVSCAKKEGDTATGYFTVLQTDPDMPQNTVDLIAILTCDADGNVW